MIVKVDLYYLLSDIFKYNNYVKRKVRFPDLGMSLLPIPPSQTISHTYPGAKCPNYSYQVLPLTLPLWLYMTPESSKPIL